MLPIVSPMLELMYVDETHNATTTATTSHETTMTTIHSLIFSQTGSQAVSHHHLDLTTTKTTNN
jgi:hypothetical protein